MHASMLLRTALLASARAVVAQNYQQPFNELIGMGAYQIQNNTDPKIIAALDSPSATSRLEFTGFNVSQPLSNSFSGSLDSDFPWSWQLNYTSTNTTDRDGNAAELEIYSYGLDFPTDDGQFPDGRYPLNTSDYQICESVYTFTFSSSVNGKQGIEGNGSCVPFFGEQCARSWEAALTNGAVDPSLGCRSPPTVSDLDGCGSILAEGSGGSVGTAAVTNTTISDLVFFPTNNSYVDQSTYQVYSQESLPRVGLQSAGMIGYRQYLGRDLGPDYLQVISLTIESNIEFVRNNSGGYGYGPSGRLLCGRASSGSSDGGSGGNGGSGGSGGAGTSGASRGLPGWGLMSVASAVLAGLGLWLS